jgi:hypothetical protein
MILFGSRARGDNFNDSDYDVIIISPDFDSMEFSQRMARMIDYWDYYPLEIEPFCYTPEEFERKKHEFGTVHNAVLDGIEI